MDFTKVVPSQAGPVKFLSFKCAQNNVLGFHCRVDFQPIAPDKQCQFLRIEEGTYENGVFRFIRVLNGDQTDGGLDFSSEPLVLRVSVATYGSSK